MSARIEDRARELRADAIDGAGFAADLTDPERVSTLVAEVGDVEILVNNVGTASLGVSDPTSPLEDMATATWAKLPAWFKVPTPLGTYNPDWAVLVEVSGEERLYFVVETKGSLFADALRDNEAAKVACGEAHFKALAVGSNPARYIKATKVDDLMHYT